MSLSSTLEECLYDIAPFNSRNYKEFLSNDKNVFEGYFKQCTSNWVEDKLDIYLVLKSYSSSYYNAGLVDMNLQKFADFCEEYLLPIFKKSYDLCKINDSEDPRHGLYEFTNGCIYAIKNDDAYDRLVRQEEVIKSYEKKVAESESKFQTAIENIKKQELSIEKSIENNKKTISDQGQKSLENSITILGIFVGVVMVFFGGFTILENTIGGMTTVTPYRLIFIMLLFGMVLFDVVVMLFYLVGKLTNKSIACQWCNYKKSTAKNSSATKNSDIAKNGSTTETTDTIQCSSCIKRNIFKKEIWNKGLCRFVRKYPYIYWTNASAVTMLVFDFLMYAFQLREPPAVGVTCSQVSKSAFGALLIFVIFYLITIVRDEKSSFLLFSYIKKRLKPKKDEEVLPVCVPAPVKENSNCNSNNEASSVYIPASMEENSKCNSDEEVSPVYVPVLTEENLKRDSDEKVSSECIPVPIEENSKRNLDEKTYEELNSEKEFAIRR